MWLLRLLWRILGFAVSNETTSEEEAVLERKKRSLGRMDLCGSHVRRQGSLVRM